MLLADNTTIEALGVAMPILLEILKHGQQRPQGLYSAACVANAASHPRLAALLNQHGGLPLCREVERQSLANLHIIGSRLGECVQTAVYKLSDRKEGDSKMGALKYR
ncbi:hypothetical protein EON65_01775 [archaeon]|nr:MAG: hypothetical protein EON65_01775 [archaeon]